MVFFISDPGSEFFTSRIPDPSFFHPGSRIRLKEFKYFNPNKWFSEIWSGFFLPIPDSGSRIQGSKSHWIPDPDPQHCNCPNIQIPSRNPVLLINIGQVNRCFTTWQDTPLIRKHTEYGRGGQPIFPILNADTFQNNTFYWYLGLSFFLHLFHTFFNSFFVSRCRWGSLQIILHHYGLGFEPGSSLHIQQPGLLTAKPHHTKTNFIHNFFWSTKAVYMYFLYYLYFCMYR